MSSRTSRPIQAQVYALRRYRCHSYRLTIHLLGELGVEVPFLEEGDDPPSANYVLVPSPWAGVGLGTPIGDWARIVRSQVRVRNRFLVLHPCHAGTASKQPRHDLGLDVSRSWEQTFRLLSECPHILTPNALEAILRSAWDLKCLRVTHELLQPGSPQLATVEGARSLLLEAGFNDLDSVDWGDGSSIAQALRSVRRAP